MREKGFEAIAGSMETEPIARLEEYKKGFKLSPEHVQICWLFLLFTVSRVRQKEITGLVRYDSKSC